MTPENTQNSNNHSPLIPLPTGVKNPAVLVQSDKFIGCRYGVQIALLSIVKVRVRFPDACQHADAQRQSVLGALKGQSSVDPRLAEVAIH